MRYANIYIYIFVLHRGFFQQPRPRVGIVKLGLDAPTWQYNDKRGCVLYLLAKASSLVKQMPTRGRVAPRLDRVAPR